MSIQKVLNAFVTLNIIQMVGVFAMMKFDQFRHRLSPKEPPQLDEYEGLATEEHTETGLEDSQELRPLNGSEQGGHPPDIMIVSRSERARGKIFFILSTLTLVATWLLFMTSAGYEFWKSGT